MRFRTYHGMELSCLACPPTRWMEDWLVLETDIKAARACKRKNEEIERAKARARKPEPNVGLTQQNNITLYYLGQYFSESLHQLNRGGNLVVLLSGTQSDLSNLSKRVKGFILIPGLGDLLGFYQIR